MTLEEFGSTFVRSMPSINSPSDCVKSLLIQIVAAAPAIRGSSTAPLYISSIIDLLVNLRATSGSFYIKSPTAFPVMKQPACS